MLNEKKDTVAMPAPSNVLAKVNPRDKQLTQVLESMPIEEPEGSESLS